MFEKLQAKVIAGLIGAALLALIVWQIYHKGVEAGKDEQKKDSDASWSKELEQARAADRKGTEELLGHWQGLYDEAKRRDQAHEATIDRLQTNFLSLQQQRAQVVQEVAKIPDAGLHDYVVTQLGLRPAGVSVPCYLPAEERKLAGIVADNPICQEQVKMLGAQVEEQRKQIVDIRTQVDATEQKFDALTGYTTRLEGHYTTLYNAFPRKTRGWGCLRLWKCGKEKPLPTPDPASLKPVANKTQP